MSEEGEGLTVSKVFIPKELEEEKSLFSFGTMSKAYWDFATEMESKALNQLTLQSISFYVFPTIIFYCASFDALLNEGLTNLRLNKMRTEDEIDCVKNIQDIIKRIKVAAIYLDKKQKGVIKENILHEYKALTELRNAIAHYNPEFGSVFYFPLRLKEAFSRSKVKPIKGSDWVETFETEIVLLWAKKTIKEMIDCFLDFQQTDSKEFYKEQVDKPTP
jgi:hypothetical protein